MKYHFIGLGGIGMSGIARILMQKGAAVQGSDAAESLLLQELSREGAKIGGSLEKGQTVVYSSAIGDCHEELKRAKELNLPILHRSDLLDQLLREKKPLLVTGTHGKTTTSALLAWTLFDAGQDPSFALGGTLSSLNTNGKAGKGPFFVAEADESDGSFLKTAPFGAIVTNLNNDHMDYWKTEAHLDQGMNKFFQQIENEKLTLWCKDDKRLEKIGRGVSFGFSKSADLVIERFQEKERGIQFDVTFQGVHYPEIQLPLFGLHNALNGAAVFGLSLQLGLGDAAIRKAFKNFPGVKRRLEFRGEARKVKIYDDYGHHPVEIRATLKAIRSLAKERRVVVVFQPHRYSRVRDFMEDFLISFSDADLVVLTDIYSAGEEPIVGITTASFYTRMKEVFGKKLHFFPRQHLESGVVEILKPLDVVVTMGAGDVTDAAGPILEKWREKGGSLKVALLFGGKSQEHEISVLSAKTILNAMDKNVYDVKTFLLSIEGKWEESIERLNEFDVCIPIFHGPKGEDGMIQGFLETLQIPYVGCDYASSAVCMHKGWTKNIALMHGIPTAPFLEVQISEYRENPDPILEKAEEFSFPLWIKPVHLGSSIGVGCAKDAAEMKDLIEKAFHLDDSILIEKHIDGRQIEFGIIGNHFLRVGPLCEILNEGSFVDYLGKYGDTAYRYAIPAILSKIETDLGIDLAKKTYRAMRCSGLARIDFFIDHEGHFWLNEINPMPGCTDTSAFPKIWEREGKSMGDITDELIATAMERARR